MFNFHGEYTAWAILDASRVGAKRVPVLSGGWVPSSLPENKIFDRAREKEFAMSQSEQNIQWQRYDTEGEGAIYADPKWLKEFNDSLYIEIWVMAASMTPKDKIDAMIKEILDMPSS